MNFLEMPTTFWWQVILGTLFTFYVPGYTLVAAIFPGPTDLKPFARSVLSMACSMAMITVIGIGLLLMEQLNAPMLWQYTIGTSAFLFVVALLRRFYRSMSPFAFLQMFTWRNIAIPAIIVITSIPFVYGYIVNPMNTPNISSWRYMADTVEMLDAGKIPDGSLQWDVPMDFVNNKISFYMFSAAWLLMTDLQDMIVPAMNGLPILMRFFAMAAAALLLLELVPASFTALGLLCIFWSDHFLSKLHGFNGEGFGIGFLFIMLWLAHKTIFESNRRLVILSPLLFTMLVLSHGVAGLVGIIMMGTMYLLRLIKWPIDFKLIGQGAYVLGVTGGVCLAILLITGNGSFTGSDSVMQETPYIPYRGGDPTRALNQILSEGRIIKILPPIMYKSEQPMFMPVSEIWRFWVEKSNLQIVGDLVTTPDKALWVDAIILLIAAIYLLRSKIPIYRSYVWIAAIFFAFLLAFALLFSTFYETWMPAIHPIRREFDFETTVSFILLMMALTLLARSKIQWQVFFSRWIVVLVISWYSLVQVVPFIQNDLMSSEISTAGYESLAWLRANTDPSARILSNIRTTGAFQIMAERQNITEGRTTYLNPTLLHYSLNMIDKVRDFMMAPNLSDLLQEYDVDYVVFTTNFREFGGHNFMAEHILTERTGVETSHQLEPVAQFENITIYQVKDMSLTSQ